MKKKIRIIAAAFTALALVACEPTSAPEPAPTSSVGVPPQFDYNCGTTSYTEKGTVQTFDDGSYIKVYEKDYEDPNIANLDICVYSAPDRDFYQEVNSDGEVSTQDHNKQGPDLIYNLDRGNVIKEENVSGDKVVYTANVQYVMNHNYITHMEVINPDQSLVSYDYFNFKDTHTKLDLSKFDIPDDIKERIAN